ncbi:MAG: serine/threonine protein kinase [Candidatus Brocadiaceae bacterium]|nr:serine/threonine protein kinase [Candidatus Brocadiaceae bacterium]
MEENFRLGRFECISKSGSGAMGNVYKAIDRNFGDMVVALKVLNAQSFVDAHIEPPVSSDKMTASISLDATIPLSHKTTPANKQINLEIATTMLAKEAAAAARINHPNVVRIYNTDEISGKQYISMEYIDGEDFAKILSKKGKLSLNETLKYGIQICRGLRAAHVNNIVHRDIKPSNLMLTKDDVVKITDLGIAKFFEDINTGPHVITIGTLTYMSPQQLLGQKADARCDIYSFGIVLYELLTGHPPFRTGDIIHQHLNILPKPSSQFVNDLPKEIDDLILKCLQKNPDDRYQNIDELLKDFVRCTKPSKVKNTSKYSTSSKQSQRKLHTAIEISAFVLIIIIIMAFVLSKKDWNKNHEQPHNGTHAIENVENLQNNNLK